MEYILASVKEVALTVENKKISVEIVRRGKEQRSWESHGKIKVTKIAELLESFERNPNETRTKLRIKLGFAGKIYYYFLNFFKI